MSLICLILRKKREFKEDARKVSTQETTLKPTPRATEKTRVLHVEFCAKTTRGQKTCERTKANDSTFRFDAERVSPRDANLNCSRFTSHRFHTHRYARWFSFASSWKIGRTKKARPSLSISPKHSREEKVSEISHFPPHARTKICTNFAKTYLDVVERPFTEEFHFLRGEFSHTVRLYFMRVVVNEAFFRIFKQSEGSKKQPKIFFLGLQTSWGFLTKKQKQNTSIAFSSFFLFGFGSVLW